MKIEVIKRTYKSSWTSLNENPKSHSKVFKLDTHIRQEPISESIPSNSTIRVEFSGSLGVILVLDLVDLRWNSSLYFTRTLVFWAISRDEASEPRKD